jgi:DNA-binding NarL/FixJ family response regulator
MGKICAVHVCPAQNKLEENMEISSAVDAAGKKNLSLIWIDDELSDGDARLVMFKKKQINVEAFSDAELARQRLSERPFDVAVIDLLMPGFSGVDLISEIIDKHMPVRPVVYSGYISTDEVNDYELLRDNDIPYFDKNVTNVDELAIAVDDLYRKEERSPRTRELLTRNKVERPRSILDYGYEEFKNLPQEDRYLLTLQAEKTLRDIIDEYQRKGAVWLLYGGRKMPPMAVYDYSDVPETDEIQKICRERNIPKLQYYMNVEIDDLSWRGSCSTNLKHYPLIGLKSAISSASRAVHFDTGSPITLFDREILTSEFGIVIDETDDLVSFPINNVSLGVYVKQASFFLIDPSGRTPRISIRVHIPREWVDCPIRARYCTEACGREKPRQADAEAADNYGQPTAVDGKRFVCRHRWGLVGRNLLFETEHKLVLDGKERLVSLLLK